MLVLSDLAGSGFGPVSMEVAPRTCVGIWGPSGSGKSRLPRAIATWTRTGAACAGTIVRPEPWYTPQYAIPLLGMLLGNTMNGIGLALDRLTEGLWQQRDVVEARLMLGETALAASGPIRREAVRSGLMPIINAMAAAGVVSLPGMMTGQILAGVPPVEAVKYQILILFLIAAGSGFGTLAAVSLATRRLFDHRQRLRLDRLQVADGNRGD
jgi:putative ABC transport system permease protein